MIRTHQILNALLFLACSVPIALADPQTVAEVVLRDDFDKLPSGPLCKILWARAEYHYLPECAPKGPWTITAYSSSIGSQRAWKVIEHAGRNALLQEYSPRSEKHTHPMVVAGDAVWKDYTLITRFAPQIAGAQSGVVFRYQNDRCYYFFGVESAHAVLKMVRHETSFRTPFEQILAKQEFAWTAGDELLAEISVAGPKIKSP